MGLLGDLLGAAAGELINNFMEGMMGETDDDLSTKINIVFDHNNIAFIYTDIRNNCLNTLAKIIAKTIDAEISERTKGKQHSVLLGESSDGPVIDAFIIYNGEIQVVFGLYGMAQCGISIESESPCEELKTYTQYIISKLQELDFDSIRVVNQEIPFHEINWINRELSKLKSNFLSDDEEYEEENYDDIDLALHKATLEDDTDKVRQLIAKGADINAEHNGFSALMTAELNGNTDMAKLLIDSGADVNFCIENDPQLAGMSVLMNAACEGKKDIVQLLLDGGADIDLQDDDGCTALMLAVISKKKDIVRLLVDKGADIEIQSNDGKTALDFAKEYANKGIIKILSDATGQVNIVCKSCGAKISATNKFCPECGVKLGTAKKNNQTEKRAAAKQKVSDSKVSKVSEKKSKNISKNIQGDEKVAVKRKPSNSKSSTNSVETTKQVSKSKSVNSTKRAARQSKKDVSEQRKEIIEKYLKDIAGKTWDFYCSEWLEYPANSQMLQNIYSHIAPEIEQSDILGFIDTTVFGKGKNGMLFTKDALYQKDQKESFVIKYSEMNLYRNGNSLFFKDSKWRSKGMLTTDGDCCVFNYVDNFVLEKCLKEIKETI